MRVSSNKFGFYCHEYPIPSSKKRHRKYGILFSINNIFVDVYLKRTFLNVILLIIYFQFSKVRCQVVLTF